MELKYFGQSDIGKVRKTNEDYFANEKISNDEFLFIVADGMGGHQAGDVASRIGTLTFVREYKAFRKKNLSIIEAMNSAVNIANNEILNMASADIGKRGMGTTFSALVIHNNHADVTHVGDSRIYLIRKNEITKLTKDHTFVEKMVEEGRITPAEARNHPQKNILYMSLGARVSFDPDFNNEIELKDGDSFLMCTDGLNGMIPDHTLKDFVQSYSPEEAVTKLIHLANDNGGMDNITVQVISVGNTDASSSPTEPVPIEKGNKNKKMRIFYVLVIIIIILLIWMFRLN